MPTIDEMIEFLVAAKFTEYREVLQPGSTVRRAGTHEMSEEERQRRLAEINTYTAELRGKSWAELADMCKIERERRRDGQRRRLAAIREREDKARFYNRPEAVADYAHWAKAAYWTLDEGVALLLGKSPDVVCWERLRDHIDGSVFAKQYAKIFDLACRAQESGRLQLRNEPRRMIEWAESSGIDCPAELKQEVMRIAGARPDGNADQGPQQVGEKPLSVRERETVLKIIGGLAKKYGYNPDAYRNPAISEIARDLDLAGVHLDTDTIRKWVKEAADSLPPEAFDQTD